MAFVHLHTHSEYSLLDGANRIPELLARVQALGMDSLAITDHGNLHGAWQFYSEARAHKIRPILGFEAYLAFGDRHKRERPPPEAPGAYSHLVLLARNSTGDHNLVKLSPIGFLEGSLTRFCYPVRFRASSTRCEYAPGASGGGRSRLWRSPKARYASKPRMGRILRAR